MSMITFLEMLEFKRPAWSVFEDAFIDRYIMPLSPRRDGFGNLIVDVGSNPNILWSSHTDTVHTESGLQRVIVDKNRIARVRFPLESNCLGADCTTGVYIMIEMIKAKVPGRYVFHRDEETGRNGSIYIATKTPDLLTGIQAAVAFDRKGLTDVITHQSTRTASDEFANSFAAAIGMGYKPNANGMYTDTKSYMGLVPECTNISVGYAGAHSKAESQDLVHLEKLTEAMRNFDSSGLVIKRTPEEAPVYNYQRAYGGYIYTPADPVDVWDLVRQNPKSVATLLEMVGWDFDTLKDAIEMIQSRKDNEMDIWDDATDTDGHKLPKSLIGDGNRFHRVGIT